MSFNEILTSLLLIYLAVGVFFGFFGPLARDIELEALKYEDRDDVGPIKYFLYLLTLRLGAILLYPIFLLSH
jgi:hypothetical protein